jgi:hypothetical protein
MRIEAKVINHLPGFISGTIIGNDHFKVAVILNAICPQNLLQPLWRIVCTYYY